MNVKKIVLAIIICCAGLLQAADGTLNTAFFNSAGNTTPPNGGGTTPGIWYIPNSGIYTGNTQAFSVAMQNGKVLVGGYIRVSTSQTPCILRLFADGTVDTTFGTDSGFTFINSAFFGQSGTFINIGAGVANAVLGLTVDANNKILVGCRLVFTANPQRFAVVRLLENGGRDTTFNPGPSFNTSYGGSTPGLWYITSTNPTFTSGNSGCSALMVQPDGKIVMAGFVGLAGTATIVIGRLNSDGTLDTAGFNAAGTVPGLWYKADAATTPVDVQAAYFNSNTDCISPKSIAIQSDGRILVGGRLHSTTPNLVRVGIIALTSAGVIDTTFNPTPSASSTMGGDIPGYFVFLTGSGSFSTGAVNGLIIDSAQNILVTGSTLFSGTTSVFVMRLTPNGVIDPTFGGQASPYGATAGLWIVTSSSVLNSTGIGCTVAFDTFNRIIVAFTGRIASTASQKIAAARLTTNGILDTTFNPSPGTGNPYGGVTPGLWYFSTDNTGTFNGGNHVNSDMVVSNNGQIFLACYPTIAGPVQRFACVSLINKCGILQDVASPFNTGANGLIITTTIDQAGKIVAGGYYGTNGMALRYTSTAGRDGSGATNFGTNGVLLLTSLTATSSFNKIINAASNTYLATGQSNNNFTTLKLTSAGALDTSFNTNGYVIETSITGTCAGYDMLLNGTELAVAGVTGTTNAPTVINYNSATGARTAGIGDNGWQQFSSLLGTGVMYGIQTTTIGTQKYGAGQATNTAFVRLLGDSRGLLQDTASPFNTSANGLILTTTIDQAGKIVTGGYYGTNAMATRYNASGTPVRDNTFDSDGALLLTSLAATSSLNKIINAASNTYLATGQANNQFATVKLTSAGALDISFNSPNGFVTENSVGVSQGYDMLLNGTALTVAGVTNTTTPSVINYEAATGARNDALGQNGWQQFGYIGTGALYGVQFTTGLIKYGAGQGSNTAFVRSLGNPVGLLQDTAAPFNTGANALLYSTTITQAGNLLVGGQYGTTWEVVSYTPAAARDGSFGTNGIAAAPSGFNAGRVRAVALDSVGRIIATGATINASPEMFTTVRYNSAGTSSTTGRETTFGVGSGMGIYVNEDDTFEVVGFTTTGTSETPTIMSYDENVNLLNVDQFTTLVPGQFYAIQEADGNFFAAGSSVDTAILYPLLDGTGLLRDTEPPFNTGYNGRMYGGIMDSNFSIVLCGTYNNIFTVVRYTSVGERDPFDVGVNGVLQESSLGVATGYAITQDSTGSYYVAAESTVGGNLSFTVVKYLYSGVLDTTFGNGGIIQETALGIGKASAIKINNDGTIFVGGQTTVNGVLLPTLIKYTSTGARFSTFGINGVQTFSNFGTGTLNDLIIISISTVAAAGQMGSVATIVQVGQTSDLLAQLNNGF